MRSALTLIHRWIGLSVAVFLIVAGSTGAVISWDHELDDWLNADILDTPGRGPLKTPLQLAAAVEAADPRVAISYMTLALQEGHAASFLVRPKTDAVTGKPYALDYNNVLIDPVTAAITGHRDSASVALSRRNLMPWLRHLHESLHIPPFWGSDRWGFWLMGGVALMWFLDSFVAMVLTWPAKRSKKAADQYSAKSSDKPANTVLNASEKEASQGRGSVMGWLRRWGPAWLVRWSAGGYKLNFDLHRAGGLWVWAVILVISFTSFSLNLYREVFYPAMSLVSSTTPGPYETIKPAPFGTQIEPQLSFADAIHVATEEGQRLKFAHAPAGIWWGADFPFYNVSFFDPEDEMGAMGMGLSNIYVSSQDGSVLGTHQPWHGTAADVFVQLQLPLHSGRILGLPGRILMSIMGLMVVMLTVTGVVIWEKKRRARRPRRAKN